MPPSADIKQSSNRAVHYVRGPMTRQNTGGSTPFTTPCALATSNICMNSTEYKSLGKIKLLFAITLGVHLKGWKTIKIFCINLISSCSLAGEIYWTKAHILFNPQNINNFWPLAYIEFIDKGIFFLFVVHNCKDWLLKILFFCWHPFLRLSSIPRRQVLWGMSLKLLYLGCVWFNPEP